MKIKTARSINLTDQGKGNWERTEEFNKKLNEIKRELFAKYSLILSTEKNWYKRQIISIRRGIETMKRIDELSSWKNLHVKTQWY